MCTGPHASVLPATTLPTCAVFLMLLFGGRKVGVAWDVSFIKIHPANSSVGRYYWEQTLFLSTVLIASQWEGVFEFGCSYRVISSVSAQETVENFQKAKKTSS
ncbi:hypothetical protein L218DRAFT_960964, partial [Marasmius fiardii PR-910]